MGIPALKKLCALILLLAGTGSALYGEITFGGVTLSRKNRLLFQALAEGRGHETYRTLFLADLESGSRSQLTFFPEDIHFLPGTGGLQIQNRYGVFRTDKDFSRITPLDRFPSFLTGKQVRNGKMPPVSTSPDGRFILYIEETSPAYGNLLLFDSYSSKVETVSRRVELSFEGPAAEWSPDSRFFVYARDRGLYYFSIEYFLSGRHLAENFRRIGGGGLSSLRWGKNNELYLISGTLIYKMKASEFFTRTLYQTLIRGSETVGKIPFSFDPNFDKFWISPDGNYIVLCMDGRNVFLYTLLKDDYLGGESISLPYLYLPRNTRVRSLAWGGGVITLLTLRMEKGEEETSIYRINLAERATAFRKNPETDVSALVLSPDEASVALLKDNSIEIRDYTNWQLRTNIVTEKPLKAVWAGDNIIVGDSNFIRSVSTQNGESRIICLSQPDSFGLKGETVHITARGAGRTYDPDSNTWQTTHVNALDPFAAPPPPATSSPALDPVSTATSAYRIFLDTLPSGPLRNTIMVRSLKGEGTYALFSGQRDLYEPLSASAPDEKIEFTNFNHGSRMHRREVSFVFNAIDSVDGLQQVLEILAQYKIKATFFINGDFIRRNPDAVREIADSGHETGSLFFAYFNITDPRFEVTDHFIQQGLARNEDEYYAATGKELSLLWHAPYYFIRSDIIEAAQKPGYMYIGRDVDSLDWVARRGDSGVNRLYYLSSDLVERVLEQKKPGSIISMSLGRPDESLDDNKREDYLFQKLELLINQLIARGYEIVPVSTLVDHAR
ncbi:MAG: polysaccharide deacetylase family protein [Spirochaetales bacterium]|jgi:peptidoglycan/xylan/chitin deacetylase (PgdA/CDA1 family)|nr:polysaccharide deacetylase family protein [Spirochaetales bacterium]